MCESVPAGFFLIAQNVRVLQILQAFPEIGDERFRQVEGQIRTADDPLHRYFFCSIRQRISRYLPSMHPQTTSPLQGSFLIRAARSPADRSLVLAMPTR